MHLAAHHLLVHGLVQGNQRLLEEPAQPLARQQLGKMVLQLGHPVRRQETNRRFDFHRQRHRRLDGEPEHRLQRRIGERHDRAGAPAFGQQLLDQAQARDLVGWIYAIAERVAERRGKAVAALPHVQLLAPQSRDADDFADVQGIDGLTAVVQRRDSGVRAFAAARRCFNQNAHFRRP